MDKETKTLDKLDKLIDSHTIEDFDEEDIQVLKRVIVMVRGFDALGSFAEFVSKTIIWLGIVIGGLVAFKSGVIDFILSAMKGQ